MIEAQFKCFESVIVNVCCDRRPAQSSKWEEQQKTKETLGTKTCELYLGSFANVLAR